MMQQTFSCYASSAFGIEGLVADELRMLNMRDVQTENGGVRFSAGPEELLICNLNLHFCDRVFIVAAEGDCTTFEELFQLVFSVRWDFFLQGDEAINISAKCARSRLMSPRDCQSITKKAIIEKIKLIRNQTVFRENGSEFPVLVTVHSDHTKVMINTSGYALSRRGYRTWNGDAPLRETLAAALVKLSPWKPDRALYDPCCGTGTILIEASLMALGRAPGIQRAFAMESFSPFRDTDIRQIRKQFQNADDTKQKFFIAGSDISPEAIELAKRHIKQANVTEIASVHIEPLQSVNIQKTDGVFICNPPYGERLSDQKTCRKLYADLYSLWKRHKSWSFCAISSDPSFEKSFGQKADRKRRLYNGRLECNYYIYY